MNLKRYNEFLIAIVGTGVPLVILSTIAWNLIPHGHEYTPPGVTAHAASGTPANPKERQRLALCLPAFMADTDWQYVPLMSTIAEGGENAHIGPYFSQASFSSIAYDSGGQNGLDGCDGLRDPRHSVIFNVLVRNSVRESNAYF